MERSYGGIGSYLIGAPLALLGLLLMRETPLGLMPLIGGLLLLPPARKAIDDHWGRNLSRGSLLTIGAWAVISAAIVSVLVIPSGGGVVAEPNQSKVGVSAVDSTPGDAEGIMAVSWNSQTKTTVGENASDMKTYTAADGHRYVVIRMNVTNLGNRTVGLSPAAFRLEAENQTYDDEGLYGPERSLQNVTLAPNETVPAKIAFEVPNRTTSVRLVVDQSAVSGRNVTVTFLHKPNIPTAIAGDREYVEPTSR